MATFLVDAFNSDRLFWWLVFFTMYLTSRKKKSIVQKLSDQIKKQYYTNQ